MQYNFALFFGLAVQMYEATLVSNDSPYDRFVDGDPNAISAQAILGVDVFRSQARGRCINCHENAELTGASVRRVRQSPLRIREGQALDRGFNSIGVLWTDEDLGVGGKDPFGASLSTVRLLDPPPLEPIAVDGAFKVPGLRNVELTAPYFHTGGFRTLHEVVQVYSRGGDAVPIRSTDGSLVIAGLNVLANTEGRWRRWRPSSWRSPMRACRRRARPSTIRSSSCRTATWATPRSCPASSASRSTGSSRSRPSGATAGCRARDSSSSRFSPRAAPSSSLQPLLQRRRSICRSETSLAAGILRRPAAGHETGSMES